MMYDTAGYAIAAAVGGAAVGAIITALFAYRHRKIVLGWKEALRWFDKRHFQEDYIEAISILEKEKEDAAQYADFNKRPKEGRERDEWMQKRKILKRVLNYCEVISMGVTKRVLHKSIIEATFGATMCALYERSEPFIRETQKQHEKAFSEFVKFTLQMKERGK